MINTIDSKLEFIFSPNKKCIVNADLDGILSGMILQHYLGWEIVGFSSCGGRPQDELWLRSKDIKIDECVFVDLPVSVKDFSVIDQHFVTADIQDVVNYKQDKNKINPNVLRSRVFLNEKQQSEYTSKYPFGTFHFILASLEKIGVIKEYDVFDFSKRFDNFDLADLILKADSVIKNTNNYTANCLEWSDWLSNLGGQVTKNLFDIVKTEYKQRSKTEINVERKMISLGCMKTDGDCSNMIRSRNYAALKNYFDFLANCFNLNALPVFELVDFSRLTGKRITINRNNISLIKSALSNKDIFSFAFVTMNCLSITYIN